MIIGVMSDTHGNSRLMHAVATLMTKQLGVSTIFHLGDNFADGQELEMAGYDVRLVPGLWCPEYHDHRVRRWLCEDLDGLSVGCAHAERDLRHEAMACGLILLGHTHAAGIEQIGFSLYVNPGHMKALSDRGERASFATISILPDSIRAAIHEVNGLVREERSVPRAALA